MNEKEAREMNQTSPPNTYWRGRSDGYLEGIEKAKRLEAFVKDFRDTAFLLPMDLSDKNVKEWLLLAKQALAKWEKEK